MSDQPEDAVEARAPDHTERPSQVGWGLLDAIGALLGFVVLSLAASFGLGQLGLGAAAAGVIATLIGWLSLAGWPLLVTRLRGNGPRIDLALEFRSIDLGLGALASLVVFGASVVFALGYLAWTGEVPTSAVGDVAEGASSDWQIISLVVLSLCAPFVEELHFRGMWWSALTRRGLRPWPTLLVTSALFAALHLEPERAPLLFAAGLAAGFVRMLTGRLGPAIVTHFLVNLLAAIGLLTLL